MMLPERARTALDKIIEDAEAGETAPFRALAMPRLHPYLATRDVIWKIGTGSVVLCGCVLRGLRWALSAAFSAAAGGGAPEKDEKAAAEIAKDGEGKGKKADARKGPTGADVAERFAIGALSIAIAGVVVVIAVAAAGPRLAPYAPIATGILIPGWLIAALVVAPEKPQKQAAAEPEWEPESEAFDDVAKPPADTPEGRRLTFLRWLEKATRNAPGMHLDQMHAGLVQEEFGDGFPRHHLRALLEQYGIPVQRTLRVGPVAGRSGVTREAILAALKAAERTPPLSLESGRPNEPETGSDLQVSTDSTSTLQPVESGV